MPADDRRRRRPFRRGGDGRADGEAPGPGRTGLPAARRGRRDRHESRPLRLRAAATRAPGSRSISASPSPARICPASISSSRTSPISRKSGPISPASSSRTRTRTISARCSTSGRGSGSRSTRRRSPPACSPPSAPASRTRPRSRSRSLSPGQRFTVGPFDVEYITVAHSIPESYALAHPHAARHGRPHRRLEARRHARRSGRRPTRRGFAAIGARACWRSSAIRPTRCAKGAARARATSPRELDDDRCRGAQARVAFTTFASNVGRIRSIALAAAKAGRERRRRRPRACAAPSTSPASSGISTACRRSSTRTPIGHLPRDKVVAILTGSQGEPRAALARVAEDDHPVVELSPGDLVVFSSRTIPGNEIADQPDRQQPDRARHQRHHRPRPAGACLRSSAPRRACRQMYEWLKPQIAGPVHGEAMHLAAQADFGRANGRPDGARDRNGTMVRLAPPPAAKVDDIAAGRLYKDGKIIGDIEDVGVPERRRLAFAGQVSVSLVLGGNGEVERDPEIALNRPAAPRRSSAGRSRRRCSPPCSARSIRSRGRAGATPRWCARRSGVRSGRRSPRRGARSRIARSSLRSYDAQHDRPPQPRRHRRAGHCRRGSALSRRNSARASPPRCRSPSTA